MAYTAGRKIVKAPGESLDKFEDSVNQVRMCVSVVVLAGRGKVEMTAMYSFVRSRRCWNWRQIQTSNQL